MRTEISIEDTRGPYWSAPTEVLTDGYACDGIDGESLCDEVSIELPQDWAEVGDHTYCPKHAVECAGCGTMMARQCDSIDYSVCDPCLAKMRPDLEVTHAV